MRNQHGRFDRLKAGTGHDGKSRAFAKPGEKSLSVHHDPNEARAGDVGVKGNIARDGAPKALHPVSVHNGMTQHQQGGAGIGGQGHATATIDGGQTVTSSAAAAPLQHAYGKGIPKVRDAAPPAFGMLDAHNRMRARGAYGGKPETAESIRAIGQAVLDEACLKAK